MLGLGGFLLFLSETCWGAEFLLCRFGLEVVERHRGDGGGFLLGFDGDGEKNRLASDLGWVGQPVGF